MELINAWLGCDDAAGRQAWFEAGAVLQDAALFGVYRRRACGQARWEVWRRGMELDPAEIDDVAAAAVLGVHDRLKRGRRRRQAEAADEQPGVQAGDEMGLAILNEEGDREPYVFPGVAQFLAYLNVSVEGWIIDSINKIPRRTVTVEGKDDPETEDDGRGSGPFKNGLREEEERELALIEEDLRTCATSLLGQFQATLKEARKGALQQHLDDLQVAFQEERQIELALIAAEIIVFLQIAGTHHEHITARFQARGQQANTVHVHNLRLRREWREFREGPGRDHYQRYLTLLRRSCELRDNLERVRP